MNLQEFKAKKRELEELFAEKLNELVKECTYKMCEQVNHTSVRIEVEL